MRCQNAKCDESHLWTLLVKQKRLPARQPGRRLASCLLEAGWKNDQQPKIQLSTLAEQNRADDLIRQKNAPHHHFTTTLAVRMAPPSNEPNGRQANQSYKMKYSNFSHKTNSNHQL